MQVAQKLARQAPRALRARGLHSTRATLAKILCSDPIDPVCIEIFEKQGHQVDSITGLGEDELCGIIGDYDGLVVRSATKVTPKVMDAATNLKVIGRAGVGIDNIDTPHATRRGIMVMNTPGGNTVSTAQLAVSLICSAARSIPAADMSMKAGKWERKAFSGVELKGKTLAIVGCGRIGMVVAKWAGAMGMRLVGYDPALPQEVADEYGIELASLEAIWPQADFITLHTPLTPDTKDLVNAETLAQCKDGVRIVNCARGGIIDEHALLDGLNSGKVAAAALDVYSSEPPPAELADLIAHPNLISTPHLGASTSEAQINVARDVALQMCDTLMGRDYVGVVNVKFMAMAQKAVMRPFMKLGEQIGEIVSQCAGGNLSSLELRTWGGMDIDITKPAARELLKACVLRGALRHIASSEPTLIAAPFLAGEMGIDSSVAGDIVRPEGPYRNLISVDITTSNGQKMTVTGSVFGEDPHIVQINDHNSFPAFVPEDTLLMFKNEDKPGAVLGALDVLRQYNINVAKLRLSRQDNDVALCLMTLDSAVPAQAVEQLDTLGTLSDVRTANFA
uniref:D-3-phosphoglycerate dehydrogenase n=1 Tax=Phaeomonas parva TaxID=124430 RepID=A0A6U4F3N0_9STRA|mmetsp:Transcript_23268/g.72737  ORF Transcript_23268/g.72737 Transcript_23268/m.72737 type:complete len:564 (+) Transcript_23268:112-1803(+)